MKTIRLILTAIAVMGFTACGNNTLKPEDMTGWKTKALLGPVEKVTYSNGDYVKFDRNGNIVEEKNGKEVRSYQYENPERYKFMNQFYNVEYKDSARMRIHVWDSGTTERLSTDYVFDERGRIKSESEANYGYGEDISYVYNDNGFLPYQIVSSFYDEEYRSIRTETFDYTEKDYQGNWLKCTVDVKAEISQWDEETDETETETKTSSKKLSRSIIYFTQEAQPAETPQSSKAIPTKKETPREVAIKCMESIMKGDYKSYSEYMWVYDGASKEQKGFILKENERMWSTQINKRDGMKGYSIYSEKITDDGITAYIKVDITYGNGMVMDEFLILTQHDGIWKLGGK